MPLREVLGPREVAKELEMARASAFRAMSEESGLLEPSDLEAQQEPPVPKACAGHALIISVTSMALILAALLLMDSQNEQESRAHVRLLQAAGGGSAVGSCWLKCGAAVGKTIHTVGTFISKTCLSAGRCIHNVFSSVNEGFQHCCGSTGEQLLRCPGCGQWCSHGWIASGRCMGGCCMSLGELINGSFMVFGQSIAGFCNVLSGFFHSMWSSCGYFLNEMCCF